MSEQDRASMRVSITLLEDTHPDIFTLLSHSEHNRPEIVRRLIDYALNQFPPGTLSPHTILNGAFYAASGNSKVNGQSDASSQGSELVDAEKIGKLTANMDL